MITAKEARKLAETMPNCRVDIADRIQKAAKLGEFQLVIYENEIRKIRSEYGADGCDLLASYFVSFGYKVITDEDQVVINW
jgi:hypothetical protein